MMRESTENNIQTIWLEGRLDALNAQKIEKELMGFIDGRSADVSRIILDLADLDYISSAGLRVVLKIFKKLGDALEIINVNRDVYDVFEMTGFTSMLNVKRAYREVSVDGLDVIGTGFYGTVYRLDPETIVKAYHGDNVMPIIEYEKKVATKAFQVGIPTAISYDIVKVGNDYGTVFELFDAKTFNELIINNEKPMEEIVDEFVKLLKEIHSTELEAGEFPSFKEKFIDYLDVIGPYLTTEQIEGLKALLMDMPEEYTVVHGDMQLKNVMLVGDEPMLIDMETLGLGNPVFEMAALYVSYRSFCEDDENNAMSFLGMTNEMVEKLWNNIFNQYFESYDDSEKEAILNKIALVATMRFLYILNNSEDDELKRIRVARTREHIDELLKVVDSLAI